MLASSAAATMAVRRAMVPAVARGLLARPYGSITMACARPGGSSPWCGTVPRQHLQTQHQHQQPALLVARQQRQQLPFQQQPARGFASRKHKKMLKLAKGYRGRANSCYSVALQRVEKALQYAYRDRRTRKREYRKEWIQRINAATRQHGMVYSKMVCGMNDANIALNRKVLADLAITEPLSFKAVVDCVKSAPPSAAL